MECGAVMSCAECSGDLVLTCYLRRTLYVPHNEHPACAPQMTVSGKRGYPGDIIPALLDVLPEGRQCYLIFCVDNQPNFQVTGLPVGPLGQRKQQLRVLSLDLARQSQAVGLL